MGGRKSRYSYKVTKTEENVWHVAIYIRLSVEDGDDKLESNSVKNQRKLIKMFVDGEEALIIVDYYIDDGYSGTDFNRPDFQRMLHDIKDGKINCVIVKDLSRLGRNYIEVGNYLEQIFPLYNVRFISINDNIDSYKDPQSVSNVIVPFKNLMNDEYCRDISNKVKSVFDTKRKNGQFIGGIAPYGYLRDPKDKHHLIIDKEPAKVIKTIFRLALEGYGAMRIAHYLNDMGIYNPTKYKQEVLKIKCGNNKGSGYWTKQQVSAILKNQVYCGDMIQGKERRISYKIHKSKKLPKEEWIIVKDTHEAIIDRETFNKVQDIIFSRDSRVDNSGKLTLFAGHIKCADCHRGMTRVSSHSKKYEAETGKKRYLYYCSTYARKSHNLCSKHSIRSDVLEEIVLKTVKHQISLIIDVEKIIKNISKDKDFDCEKELLKKKLENVEIEIEKCKKLKKSVYEDWKEEILTKEEYFEYSKDYEKRIERLTNNKENIEKQLKGTDNTPKKDDKWIKVFKERKNITKLTKEVVDELIDNIYVHEEGKISIVFKYNDEYKRALEFIKENKKEYNNSIAI